MAKVTKSLQPPFNYVSLVGGDKKVTKNLQILSQLG
jgi:hypothetical protein